MFCKQCHFLLQFLKTSQTLCCFHLSSIEEAEDDCQSENIPEAMEVDNVPEATTKRERIATLEAELE